MLLFVRSAPDRIQNGYRSLRQSLASAVVAGAACWGVVATPARAEQAGGTDALPVVTILTEGYVAPIAGRAFVPGERPDGARKVATTVLLVQSPEVVLVADPGMVSDRRVILDPLERAGVSPEDVTHVFVSHHHLDHTTQIALFPNAKVVDFAGIYQADLWSDHPDEYPITKHIKVWKTPGHTHEDASLIIETADGTVAYTHLWWTEDQQPEVDPLAEAPEDLIEQRKRILAIADRVITAHGGSFENRR